MKRPTLKQRLSYWLDNRMARGTGSMIRLLALATIALALLVAAAVTVLGLQEEGDFGGALWDSFASTINAWVFYSDDGSLAYVLVMALAAVAGLFVTSLLIGIVGSGIEEKLSSLRRGNSVVLESGHIVILGFNQEVYRIVNELCAASANLRRQCLVVMGREDKEAMEEGLRELADIPGNMHVICRSGDPGDPAALRCCAIPACRAVIINESLDRDAVKTVLAVTTLMRQEGAPAELRMVACVSGERSVLPARIAGEDRIDVLHVDGFIARMLAHSCRQAGISTVITDFLSFRGDEFYIESFPALNGKTFGEAALSFQKTVALGIYRDGTHLLNPPRESVLESGDKLIILAEDNNVSRLLPAPAAVDESAFAPPDALHRQRRGNILVFGYNDKFGLMARELNASLDGGGELRVAGASSGGAAEVRELAPELSRLEVSVLDADTGDRGELERLLSPELQNIIILSDMEKEAADADADTLLLLLQLRDIKRARGLGCHITTEMRCTATQRLAKSEDVTDLIISSDVAGPLAAQVAENPALLPIFRELLSNEGNEIYLRDAEDYVLTGRPVGKATLTASAARRDEIFIGYKLNADGVGKTVVNPAYDETVTLKPGDSLILLSRN